MATAAQIAANRANALRSTGPTSPEGKAASRQNARKHGLSGSSTAALVESESDRDLIESRKALWREDYRPETPGDEEALESLAAESIRIERAREAFFALCRDHGRRARLSWDADRRRDADALALGLARAPHAVARKLEETRQGAELKRDLWRSLGARLDAHGGWTDAQRALALDLLGIRPDLRDAATPADPADGDAFAARRSLVIAEIARIEALIAGPLAEMDEADRAMAEASLGAELTKPVRLMLRYERAAERRWDRARRALSPSRKARDESAPPPEPPARSQPEPEPRPAPVVGPSPVPSPRPAFVPIAAARPVPAEPSRPLNRHQRRARAAMVRHGGG